MSAEVTAEVKTTKILCYSNVTLRTIKANRTGSCVKLGEKCQVGVGSALHVGNWKPVGGNDKWD